MSVSECLPGRAHVCRWRWFRFNARFAHWAESDVDVQYFSSGICCGVHELPSIGEFALRLQRDHDVTSTRRIQPCKLCSLVLQISTFCERSTPLLLLFQTLPASEHQAPSMPSFSMTALNSSTVMRTNVRKTSVPVTAVQAGTAMIFIAHVKHTRPSAEGGQFLT